MNDKEAKKLISDIGHDCYEAVSQWIVENWRKTIPYPVENYIHYGEKYKHEIAELLESPHSKELEEELIKSANAAVASAAVIDPLKLDRNEFMLCVDATNGFMLSTEYEIKGQIYAEVFDFIRIEKADEKWEVDKDQFLEKMNNATEEEYEKLWLQIQQYWVKRKSE